MNSNIPNGDTNILAYQKGGEWYVWLYHDGQEPVVRCRLGLAASNEELSLDWHDAGILCRRVREMSSGNG